MVWIRSEVVWTWRAGSWCSGVLFEDLCRVVTRNSINRNPLQFESGGWFADGLLEAATFAGLYLYICWWR